MMLLPILFDLFQLDELLNELAIPEAKQKRFEAIINDLKSSLKNLKPIKNIKV